MSKIHNGVDPSIVAYVEENYGDLSETIATLTYEYGVGGPIRRVVGYPILGPKVHGTQAHLRTEDFRFLPVKDADSDQRYNYPAPAGMARMSMMVTNRDRIITIVHEAVVE